MRKIFIAGHTGMVGKAFHRIINKLDQITIITRTRAQLDLRNQSAVNQFFNEEKPDEVILAAARVGGIYANNAYPAEFIFENLQIQNNVIHSAYLNNVQKLLFLGSSCIYPREISQPMREDAILSGILEPTNEPYAIAKIAGIKMCESYNRQYGVDYRAVMPTNLYGIGDNYHPDNSHVVPALIRRFHEAKKKQLNEVVVWGSGAPRREFLYVDDMVQASMLIYDLPKERYDDILANGISHVNVGYGKDVTIQYLAEQIKHVVGYHGKLVFDTRKPDGTKQKLLDVSILNKLGWSAKTPLLEGLVLAYADFKRNYIA